VALFLWRNNKIVIKRENKHLTVKKTCGKKKRTMKITKIPTQKISNYKVEHESKIYHVKIYHNLYNQNFFDFAWDVREFETQQLVTVAISDLIIDVIKNEWERINYYPLGVEINK